MNNKRKLALLVASAFVLASCGGNSSSSSQSSGSQPSASSDPASSQASSSSSTPAGPAIASGAKEFVSSDNGERTKILGKLEKYVVDTGMTGLPLFENGGYNIVSSRVVKGTEKYIPNYGFSTFRDGRPNGTLAGETNPALANYYHTWESQDPQTINGLNAEGSLVLDLFGDVQSGYFGTRLNKAKTGYEWYGVLSSKDRPYAVVDGVAREADSTELHDTWRVYLRTGQAGGVAYRTLSQRGDRKAFDGQYATRADYVNAFKVLLTKKNGYYRGGELASATSGSFIGASDFYDATEEGYDETAWARVGIKDGQDAVGDYIDFQFDTPFNRFYAMYNLASSLYCPIPADFFNLVTANGLNPGNYGSYNSDKTTTPVDNILSVGALMLERWTDDQEIVMKTNKDWWEIKENSDLYRWDGVHYAVLSGYSTDKNIAFKEYIANKLDSCGIPQTYLAEWRSNPLAAQVPGSSTFKLNTNTCDEETWEELFGEEGSIYTHQKSEYWNVKPWMSNDNFIRGLFYSIDRSTFAATRGYVPSMNYFADAYLSDPENGVSYNSTPEHAAALEDFWGDTVATYGYSEALATEAFTEALRELKASGDITDATEEVNIDLVWMYPSDEGEMGDEIVGYMQTAFNQAAEDLGLDCVLAVNQYPGGDTYEGVYDKISYGEFDLAFGAISGNALDPINFLEVLKSDNSAGFTLNWGKDTSYVDTGDNALVYENEIYSFDGLWTAAAKGVILDADGSIIDASSFEIDSTASYLDATKDPMELHVEGQFDVYDDPTLTVLPYDFFAQSGVASDYFEAYEDGYADYYAAGTTATPLVFDENGKFSVTIKGALPANIYRLGDTYRSRGFINQGYIVVYRWGLDCFKYINGLYLGVESPTHVLGDFIPLIEPEQPASSGSASALLPINELFSTPFSVTDLY